MSGIFCDVVGIVPPDAKWQRMKAIYDACELADVRIPDEVDAFFNGEAPDPLGVVIELAYNKHESVKKYETDDDTGYEVDITKLPEHVKFLRFTAS